MSDVVERTVGDLTVRVDRTLCVGFGDCVQEAPEAFRLDEEDVVVGAQVREGERGTAQADRSVRGVG